MVFGARVSDPRRSVRSRRPQPELRRPASPWPCFPGFFPTCLGFFPSHSLRIVRRPLLTPRTRTLALTALGIGAVVAAESWDGRHEAQKALEDLMQDHALLALALAAKLERATPGAQNAAAGSVELLCGAARELERTGGVVVVLKPLEHGGLRSCDGRGVEVRALADAAERGERSLVLARDEAVRLGLPERVGVAGIAPLPATTGLSAVAVTGTAASERDRSKRQQARTIVSIAVVSALILGFGLADLRRQRREVALERQVELEKTKQERDAELAKANRMATIAALASGFAHEIGTPLGIISGRVEQLSAGETSATPERRHELLEQVAQQVARVGTLVRSFLAFARGEAGLFARVSAHEVAESALRLVRHRFVTAKVELTLELAASDEATIACEPALFEQALVNVLVNALEASSAGRVVTLRVEAEAGRVRFAVLDQGSGIPEAVMARVTEPFFTTKARSGGTGLGLTIAKEIVAHHRGEFEIHRRERPDAGAVGTEVVIFVPRHGEA
jgi:two-component system NtrC family sensor kinase